MGRPKNRPERHCGNCGNWTAYRLDWGECFWMANAVPGDEYAPTYRYAPCYFRPSSWEGRR